MSYKDELNKFFKQRAESFKKEVLIYKWIRKWILRMLI